MPGHWAQTLSKPEAIGLGLLVVAVLCSLGIAFRWYWRRRPTPEDLERCRRETIHQRGKIGDGEIVGFEGSSIVYSYHVGGVEYVATQDLTGFESHLPSDRYAILGPISLKFDRRNPANSIVICEQWSGLRHLLQAGPRPDRVA